MVAYSKIRVDFEVVNIAGYVDDFFVPLVRSSCGSTASEIWHGGEGSGVSREVVDGLSDEGGRSNWAENS
jgi:hypothetical protein